jgi:WD40 repeat protein
VKKIAYHNSEQKLISIGTDNTIVEWNLASKEAREFSKLSSRPTSLAISNFTNKFVVGTRDGRVYEYDWDASGSGRLLYSADNSVLAVTYSPDDGAVVIGTMDGIVRFINRTSALAGITIRGPEARVTDLKFSFNGKYLAAASHDGNVYLWETSDWNNEPVVVDDNKGFVLALCFSGNSNYFYSGSTEAPRLIGRPVESSLMVHNFCDLVNRNLTQAEWDNYIGEDIEYQETCPGK